MPPRKRDTEEKEYLPLDCAIVRTTEKAVCIEYEQDGEEYTCWIPRSQCEGGDSLDEGDTDVRVTRWFAEKEGLPT